MSRTKQTGLETVKIIANQSSLTQDQVKECFLVTRKMIETIIKSNYSTNFEFSLPYIGSFLFSKKKGKKKGTSYLVPQKDGTKILQILEEDKPDYDFLRFSVKRDLQAKTRENSENRFLRKLNTIYKKETKNG